MFAKYIYLNEMLTEALTLRGFRQAGDPGSNKNTKIEEEGWFEFFNSNTKEVSLQRLLNSYLKLYKDNGFDAKIVKKDGKISKFIYSLKKIVDNSSKRKEKNEVKLKKKNRKTNSIRNSSSATLLILSGVGFGLVGFIVSPYLLIGGMLLALIGVFIFINNS